MTEQLYRRRAGEPVTLAECPVGLFEWEDELCVKSEYGVDSYIVSTGEMFWGGAGASGNLRAVMVTPVEYEPLPAPAPDARETSAAQLAEAQQQIAALREALKEAEVMLDDYSCRTSSAEVATDAETVVNRIRAALAQTEERRP